MTHTEKAHVVFGGMAAITGALALWHAFRPRSRARFVWPVLAFLIGFGLFIPVEAQTRTYAEIGWWSFLVSIVPDSPQHWLGDWVAKLESRHVVQHKVGSLLIMIVGVVEWQRARERLTTSRWRYVLPVLLVGIGLAFGVHGGSARHLPYRSEQIQHVTLGIAFVFAGVVQGLVESGRLAGPWRGAWAVLTLLVGLNIALFYRLAPGELRTGGHIHESAGPRLR